LAAGPAGACLRPSAPGARAASLTRIVHGPRGSGFFPGIQRVNGTGIVTSDAEEQAHQAEQGESIRHGFGQGILVLIASVEASGESGA
jgi:hypothetical protein